MGTANFYARNASKYFVVMQDCEDRFDCEERVEHWQDCLEDENPVKGFTFYKDNHCSGDRNFPFHKFGEFSREKSYGDIDISLFIFVGYRAGYYEAANLDWDIMVEIYGREFDHVPKYSDLVDLFSYYTEKLSGKQVERYARAAEKTLDKIIGEAIDDLEKWMGTVSDTYQCVARASNGEAFYQKI